MTGSITQSIRGGLFTLTKTAEKTSECSRQVASSSQSLAKDSIAQTEALGQCKSALDQVKLMIGNSSKASDEAKQLASETLSAAREGHDAMKLMQQAMEEISQSNSEVVHITQAIDEIAFQTNLLSINAVVEAARAGDAGVGFAVVAEEVRKLAQTTAERAKNTSTIIEGTIKKTQRGTEIGSEVAVHFHHISSKAQDVDNHIADIHNASKQQSSAIHQVGGAIHDLEELTHSNVAIAGQSSETADHLMSQVAQVEQTVWTLKELVGKVGARVVR